MRGKASSSFASCSFAWITPAYAGKSISKRRTKLIDRGSPPPMRGKAEIISLMLFQIRITPAYAGKRSPVFLMVQRG